MDLQNQKTTKSIKIIFLVIIIVMIIEIIIVSILLISDKKKQKEIVDNKVVKEKIDSVIDIEKEIINQKKISSKNIETTELKNLDTDPRTRPLPNLSFE